MNFSVIICGVGGQGVVLASRLLAISAMNSGFHVNTAETLGMSQRGGSVISHLQFGNDIKSSLIPEGGADLIIGFEVSEVARNLHFLKKNGKIITNSKMILPVITSYSIHYTKLYEEPTWQGWYPLIRPFTNAWYGRPVCVRRTW